MRTHVTVEQVLALANRLRPRVIASYDEVAQMLSLSESCVAYPRSGVWPMDSQTGIDQAYAWLQEVQLQSTPGIITFPPVPPVRPPWYRRRNKKL